MHPWKCTQLQLLYMQMSVEPVGQGTKLNLTISISSSYIFGCQLIRPSIMSIHLQVSNCKVWSYCNSCMSAPQTFVPGKFNLSLLVAPWFIVVLLIHNWYDWQQITVCIIQICKFMQKFTKDVVRYTNGFCFSFFCFFYLTCNIHSVRISCLRLAIEGMLKFVDFSED